MTEESSRELDNPYRGFYQLSGYILSDNQKPEKSADWCRKKLRFQSISSDASGD